MEFNGQLRMDKWLSVIEEFLMSSSLANINLVAASISEYTQLILTTPTGQGPKKHLLITIEKLFKRGAS